MTEPTDPGYCADVIAVYRRMRHAFEQGRGMRLTAEEVARVWLIDDSISQAVAAADEMDLAGEQP